MDIEIRGTVKYLRIHNDHSSIMSIRGCERATINSNRGAVRPAVRAATLLNRDSSTEVIDVHCLAQKNSSVIQDVKVADVNGWLVCVGGSVNSACWIKIVTLAKDVPSSNVILMSTEQGVVLKTSRVISPGEPLLMWFSENILAMMNMPFLSPGLNIQGGNRYVCHECNNSFEHPNPLKIHLILKCSKLDSHHIWTILAKEFTASQESHSGLSINFFPPAISSPFQFQFSESPTLLSSATPTTSPIVVNTLNTSTSPTNISSTSSNGPSPNSSKHLSPTSSSTEVSPIRRTIIQRNSAFHPYNRVGRSTNRNSNMTNPSNHSPYRRHQLPPPQIDLDVQAAQMETFYSNIGKSKQGHLCIHCGKIYSRKYGLKIHIRTHTGFKPLKCPVCLRPFGDPSNLNKHVRLHADGDTPYRCEQCGKVLVRRRDLERHIRSRHQNNAGHISEVSSDGLGA